MYISNTSLIDMTTKTDEGLIRKMADMGYDKWMEFLRERATYGTILHILIAEFLIAGFIDFDNIGRRIEVLFVEHDVPKKRYFTWHESLCYDLLAFCKFAADYKVRPLAIELPLISRENRFGGTIDLVCKLTIEEKGYFGEVYKSGPNKGAPKETKKETDIYAVIDFKSGKNGFTEKHADQLALCTILLKENYRQFDKYTLKAFNWAPKDWRTAPDYSFKDQTGVSPLQVVFAKISIARVRAKNFVPTYLLPTGIVDLGEDPSQNFVFKKVIE
jgi:hypothetical protein